jgi:hypothetical protein
VVGGGLRVRAWWAWSLALALVAIVLLAWAGQRLSGGSLGTSLAARGCDGGVIASTLLLAAGALAACCSFALARLRHPGATLALDASVLAWTVPLPLVVLAASLPAVAGCRVARGFDDLPLVGDALVGSSAIVLAGCAAGLLGAALASALAVGWLAPAVAQVDEPAGIVELAIREAEALELDESAQRFRNVDDE